MTNKNIKLVVEQDINERIDKFITSKLNDFTRSKIQNLIKEKNVYLNNKILCNNSYIIRRSDTIEIQLPQVKSHSITPKYIPLDIIYEDEYLVIINKPSGLTTHPGAGNYNDTLVNGLVSHFKNKLSSIGGEIRPGIVHRLDKNTSGLLIIAKNNSTHALLAKAMQERKVKRIYQAFIWGAPSKIQDTINLNIARSKINRKKMGVVNIGGKISITHYKVLKSFFNNAMSLIECELETGRTHQIRVHLSHLGYPIIGDPEYGNSKKK